MRQCFSFVGARSRLVPDVMWRVPFLMVRLYQRLLSPLLPSTCRFTPTCSEYAAESLRVHGFMRGGWLTVRRIARCHPFHPGGDDPVPAHSCDIQHIDTGETSHG